MSEVNTYCIIVAAGRGERLGHELPKALVPIGGKSILSHTVNRLHGGNEFLKFAVTYTKGFEKQFEEELQQTLSSERYLLVEGGKTRQQSVRFALEALREMENPPADNAIIAIHDAARCLVPPELVKYSIEAAKKLHAVTVALPEVETIKRVDHSTKKVLGTLIREELWRIQTPQVFRFSLIWEAHVKAVLEQWVVTDDASIVENLESVYVVTGHEQNIKVTTPGDIRIAEAILGG